MTMETTQVIIVLDLEGALPDADFLPQVPPAQHHREIIRLSSFRPPAVVREGPERSPVDWQGVAHATARLLQQVRASAEQRNHPSEYFVVGRAPLPVFIHAGFALSAWARPVTLLNQRKDQAWDVLSLERHGMETYFDQVSPVLNGPPVEASGSVAVFISPTFPGNAAQFRAFVRQQGERVADIVEIRTSIPKILDAATVGSAADELASLFGRIVATFPNRADVSVFVAGPASLAFLVGRAINPKVVGPVTIANYAPPDGYEFCFSLPLSGTPAGVLDRSEAARNDRARVLSLITSGVEAIRADLAEADLSEELPLEARAGVIRDLRALKFNTVPTDEFSLSILRQEMSVGENLLEALRGLGDDDVRRFGQLLTLHELFHVGQGIQSTNYRDVGRAGVTLEQIDFHADAIALDALLRRASRIATSTGARELATAFVQSSLRGVEAFDRIGNQNRMDRLPERRLRRYLTWHLQLQRATTVKTAKDITELFAERVVVELAPLRGFLDDRFDKIVRSGEENTELFVVLGSRLARQARRPGFDPSGLVEAVRVFDFNALQAAMGFMIHEFPWLVPWTTR